MKFEEYKRRPHFTTKRVNYVFFSNCEASTEVGAYEFNNCCALENDQ